MLRVDIHLKGSEFSLYKLAQEGGLPGLSSDNYKFPSVTIRFPFLR
jgi:hypothetical protein